MTWQQGALWVVTCDKRGCQSEVRAATATAATVRGLAYASRWTFDGVSWWCPDHSGWGGIEASRTATVTPSVTPQCPPFRVHDDGRIMLYAPVSRERLEQIVPGQLASTLWESNRGRDWDQVWPPPPAWDAASPRLTDDETTGPGWREAELVVRDVPR